MGDENGECDGCQMTNGGDRVPEGRLLFEEEHRASHRRGKLSMIALLYLVKSWLFHLWRVW